jgi:hypothetical protein
MFEEVTLMQYSSTEAIKSLGILTSLVGSHLAQLLKLQDKVQLWINCISNGHLPMSHFFFNYGQLYIMA